MHFSSKFNTMKFIAGPLLTAIVAIFFIVLKKYGIDIPNPVLVLAVIIAFSAQLSGSISGLTSSIVSMCFVLVYWAKPGQIFAYTINDLYRLVVFAVTMFLMPFIVGSLKKKTLDQIVELEKVSSQLKDSEKSYKEQFHSNSAVMLLIDPRDGKILDANSAAVGFYGYDKSQLLGMCITEINTLPENEVLSSMSSAEHRTKSRFEFKHRLADGSLRDVEVSSSLIEQNMINILHSIIYVITERKLNEKNLKDSENLQNQLMQSIDAVINEYEQQ